MCSSCLKSRGALCFNNCNCDNGSPRKSGGWDDFSFNEVWGAFPPAEVIPPKAGRLFFPCAGTFCLLLVMKSK